MKRKPTVPGNISAAWRAFALPRDVSLRLWNYIHVEMPVDYENLRGNRDPEGHGFRHKMVIQGELGERYLFILFVDDTTSPDHLIIADLRCIRRNP